jgi:hypothetical protein
VLNNNLAANFLRSGQIEKVLKAYEVVEMKESDPASPPLNLSTSKCGTLFSVLMKTLTFPCGNLYGR